MKLEMFIICIITVVFCGLFKPNKHNKGHPIDNL